MSTPSRGIITSTGNPLIKEIVRLRERRWRDRLGQFPVEGFREVSKALGGGVEVASLLYCPELFTDPAAPALVASSDALGITVQELGADAFRRVSYRDRPDGILAIAAAMSRRLEEIELRPPALLMVVEAIEKPGNLGALLRSCDGVGATAVLVCDGVTDIYNPNVVRASLGTLFSRPVVQCTSAEALAWLKAQGVLVVATSPHADQPYTSADLRGDVAVVVGAEDRGLSEVWLEGADQNVAIPMAGDADSLNVGMAAALVMYEALRQRQ